MRIKEIEEYAQVRAKARAYLCYIIERHISQNIINGDVTTVLTKLETLNESIPNVEAIYALDGNGEQVTANISKDKKLKGLGQGDNRSDRAYFYRNFLNLFDEIHLHLFLDQLIEQFCQYQGFLAKAAEPRCY